MSWPVASAAPVEPLPRNRRGSTPWPACLGSHSASSESGAGWTLSLLADIAVMPQTHETAQWLARR